MKRFLTAIVFFFSCLLNAQTPDTLIVHYYENYPYAFVEGGKLKGIEIDILGEYVSWLKQRKNITTVVNYKAYKDFSEFYNSVKEGRSSIVGAGSVTRNLAREKEVSFSPPYLQNVAVLISSGRLATIREKSNDDVTRSFSGVNGIAVKGSSHVNYLNNIKSQFLPDMKLRTVENQNQVLQTIISDNTTVGYVDIVAYWAFLKSNPTKFLKIQKAFTEPREELGYILPLNNRHSASLAEFFEGGFGFTSTRAYQQLLEKYLGYEVLESVEIR